ncbi:MAG: hypothetical protein ACPLKQ_06050 [Candidatus Bathyarchaeales archaeon]
MGEEVLKVTLVEEQRKAPVASLGHLEQLAFNLTEVEKLIEECKSKLSTTERELAEFRQKRELERRFSELTGVPYDDKSSELEEKVKSLKEQLESLSAEKVKLRSEILSGLASVTLPIEAAGCSDDLGEEVSFKFRDGAKYPAITTFIKKELNFGLPPVYVALTPEGVKVVGMNDKNAAVKEVIKTIESLRAKASGELGHYTYTGLNEKTATPEEYPSSKGILSPFKKLHATKEHKWLHKTTSL